jgi:hypothetical protein
MADGPQRQNSSVSVVVRADDAEPRVMAVRIRSKSGNRKHSDSAISIAADRRR